MINTNEIQMDTYLQRIANILLINGGYLANTGLYSGEMGLVLFFYRYARFTQNDIYAEYASDLLEKVQNKILPNTPLNYKQGLSGIGSAIEYLAQNDYIDIHTDRMLEEFDKRIFFTFNLPYLAIENIVDIGYYIVWRLSGNSAKKEMIIKSIMPQIVQIMEEWQTNQQEMNPMVSLFRNILKEKHHSLHNRSIISAWFELCCKSNSDESAEAKPFTHLLERFSTPSPLPTTNNNNSTANSDLDLGFQNGLAGLGLYLITELDGDNSWLSLFPNDIIPCKK